METIICIGNQAEDTCVRAYNIAHQFNLPANGLIVDNIDSSGIWHTDLGSISFENFLYFSECADAIIVLDQPIDSYDFAETFYATRGLSQYLNKFTRVIYENQFKDLYVTTNFVPPNQFNAEVYSINSNKEVEKILTKLAINQRRVFVEFGVVDNLEQFVDQLNTVVRHARKSDASLVIFRASNHEIPESMHRLVTKKLLGFPEFVMLTPKVFNNYCNNNIQQLLENHWQFLYGKSPKNYHKAYTDLKT